MQGCWRLQSKQCSGSLAQRHQADGGRQHGGQQAFTSPGSNSFAHACLTSCVCGSTSGFSCFRNRVLFDTEPLRLSAPLRDAYHAVHIQSGPCLDIGRLTSGLPASAAHGGRALRIETASRFAEHCAQLPCLLSKWRSTGRPTSIMQAFLLRLNAGTTQTAALMLPLFRRMSTTTSAPRRDAWQQAKLAWPSAHQKAS